MWAVQGGGGRGCHPMFRLAESGTDGPRRESQVPINALECSQTDDSIKALPAELAATVQHYYLTDSAPTQRALCISAATLSARISRAHQLLSQEWTTPKPQASYDLNRTWDKPGTVKT